MPTKEIVFTTRGARDLQNIFKSLRQEAEQMDKAFDRVGGSKTRRSGTSAAKRDADLKIAESKRVASAEKRAATETINAANCSSKAQIAAAKRTSNEKIGAIKREAAQSRQWERMERRIANRKQLREFTHARRISRMHRGQKSLFFDYAMGAGRRGGRMFRGAAGMAGLDGIGTIAATGTYVVGAAARQGIALNDAARRMSRKGGGAVGAEDLRRSFQQTAIDVRGVRAADVARGTEAFVAKTGDVGSAQRFQKTFAEVGLATGTDIAEIAGAAADLFEKFDIKTIEDMTQALSTLAIQGKRGSFELEDAASQFPKLAAAAQRLGIGKGTKAVATLGGLTQIAKRGVGPAEQAATALEATFRQLTSRSPELKRAGVDVFDKAGNARDIRDVLTETIGKVGGKDVVKKKVELQKIFGDEGIRAISPLITTFVDAVTRGKDGMQAVRDEMDRAIDATGALAEIQRDLKDAQQDASSKITAAWENFVIQISDKAMPGIMKALEQFSTFVEQTNFEGLGAAITTLASVTVAAAKAMGLIAPKSAGERALTAKEEQVAAMQKGNKATAAKLAIKRDIVSRGTPATPEELSTLKTLDESISLSKDASYVAGAQALSAKRLDSGADIGGTFMGISTADIRNGIAQNPVGRQFVAGEIESNGGVGTFDKIAADATRSLAINFQTVEAPLDNFAQAVLLATGALHRIAEMKPTATVIQVN